MKIKEIFQHLVTGGMSFFGLVLMMVFLAEGDVEPLIIGLPFISLGPLGLKHFRTKYLKRLQHEREKKTVKNVCFC